MSTQTTCYTWGDADFAWNLNEYTWNDVCLVVEVGGGGHTPNNPYANYKKLPQEKKEQFITLILRVKGEDEITQKKSKKDYKVTAEDIQLVVDVVLKGITVETKIKD